MSFSPADVFLLQYSFGNPLAQDDPQGMNDAGETAEEGGNDVDPEVVVDLAVLHVHGKRGDEKRNDDLQNLVIHLYLSLSWVWESDVLYPIIR